MPLRTKEVPPRQPRTLGGQRWNPCSRRTHPLTVQTFHAKQEMPPVDQRRACRYCAAWLEPTGRAGRPRVVCPAAVCRRQDQLRRRALMVRRRLLRRADNRGDVEAAKRLAASIAALVAPVG